MPGGPRGSDFTTRLGGIAAAKPKREAALELKKQRNHSVLGHNVLGHGGGNDMATEGPEHGNGMATKGASMAMTWQPTDQSMAMTWQRKGQSMAMAWQPKGQSMAMAWQYLCWRHSHGSDVGSPGCSAFLTGIQSHASTAADERETQSQRRSNAAASPTQALRTVPTAPWHSVQCKPMAQRRGAGENSVADRLLHSLRCSRARRKPPRPTLEIKLIT